MHTSKATQRRKELKRECVLWGGVCVCVGMCVPVDVRAELAGAGESRGFTGRYSCNELYVPTLTLLTRSFGTLQLMFSNNACGRNSGPAIEKLPSGRIAVGCEVQATLLSSSGSAMRFSACCFSGSHRASLFRGLVASHRCLWMTFPEWLSRRTWQSVC